MKTYVTIFARTTAGLALTALLAAQAADWSGEGFTVSASVLGWALLAAVIGGLIAVGWAFVQSPAMTPVGKAVRSAVQALLGAPIAAVVIDSTSDTHQLGDLLVPTVVLVVLAFAVSYLSNVAPAPTTQSRGVVADVVG